MRKCLSLIVACLAAFAASTYASDSRVDNIVDPYGNMFLQFVAPSATAVNNCVLKNAATGNSPTIQAVGADANVSLLLVPKGTGSVQLQDSTGTTLLQTNTGSLQSTLGASTSTGGLVLQANRQVSIAGVGNTNAGTDDTLFTYSLPANALKNVGDYVRVTAYGKAAGATHNCVCKLFFGTDTVVTSGTVSDTSAFAIRQSMTVIKTGANTQMECSDDNYFGTTANITRAVPTAGAQTDTSAIVIKFTGNCTTASEILGMGFIVEFGHQ